MWLYHLSNAIPTSFPSSPFSPLPSLLSLSLSFSLSIRFPTTPSSSPSPPPYLRYRIIKGAMDKIRSVADAIVRYTVLLHAPTRPSCTRPCNTAPHNVWSHMHLSFTLSPTYSHTHSHQSSSLSPSLLRRCALLSSHPSLLFLSPSPPVPRHPQERSGEDSREQP